VHSNRLHKILWKDRERNTERGKGKREEERARKGNAMTQSLLGKVHRDRLSVKYAVHGMEISFDVPVVPVYFLRWLINFLGKTSKLHFPQNKHKWDKFFFYLIKIK